MDTSQLASISLRADVHVGGDMARSLPSFSAPFAGPTQPSFIMQDRHWDGGDWSETTQHSTILNPAGRPDRVNEGITCESPQMRSVRLKVFREDRKRSLEPRPSSLGGQSEKEDV